MQTLTRAQINRSNNSGADDNQRPLGALLPNPESKRKKALATIIIKRDRIIALFLAPILLLLSLLRARRLLPALVSLSPPLGFICSSIMKRNSKRGNDIRRSGKYFHFGTRNNHFRIWR